MTRPRLLDLFCGAGGCARGYVEAGFDVTGVDCAEQPNYLKSGATAFVRADALDHVARHGREYDVIHASPPCQAYTPLKALQDGKTYPDLLAATRDALEATSRPWVIENVMSAPLHHGVVLCGGMFGLRTYRHRRFESSAFLWQPSHPRHVARTSTKKCRACVAAGMHVSITGDVGSWLGPICMGIDWMTGAELSQAIPPPYTRLIGKQLLAALENLR